ncbi:MAG: 50S ribosomal protein L18 [Parcubacteria group bacterium GW2011_GWA2_37_10]|nr:MAG: 50S ribosomal protein L18 [Parcubacteria group bacterium GW2011_GWA2_37_10]
MITKKEKRQRRHKKIRSKISGTLKMPRLCVFRSLNHIYAQLLDDGKAKVLLSASDREIKDAKLTKSAVANEVGKLIAKKCAEKKIEKVVFDRGGIVYHGRIKALADGAREGGLIF